MRLRNFGFIALVATTIGMTACSTSEADQPETREQQAPENQLIADASSSDASSESGEEAAQAELAAELAAQGWNGPLDLDASHLDYGMGEVTIEGEVIPMTVTCEEIPYDPRPFALDANLEGTDSSGRPVEVSVGRSLDTVPWYPHEYWQDIEGYDGYESGTLIVYREGEGHQREKFFQLSPGYGDPHAEALPGMKATDDWRFSAVAATDTYADDPTEFVLPIEIIGMCQEDWIGPYKLSTEEWKQKEARQ